MSAIQIIVSYVKSASIRLAASIVVVLMASACEAPLNLDDVDDEGTRVLRRYDVFQSAAASADHIVVVSSVGAALVSSDKGATWERNELPGRPQLIDVTACDSGDIFALDSQHRIWQLSAGGSNWTSSLLDTPESTLSIECAPGNRLWVSASFSTLYFRDLDAAAWQEYTLNEDLQFTAVRFVDELNGFAVGEFGTVMSTSDRGETWLMQEPLPNEFYPMSADFLDVNNGWVGGLDGVIWRTEDGAQTWHRQLSLNASPIYNLRAGTHGVYAVGGSGKIVEYLDGQWQRISGAPEVLGYLRALVILPDGSLVVAGGAGMLSTVSSK